ncbi:MAG: hypothetical protein H0U22_13955 [Geodermatophilaceae bacterium]|nr:hypothetical protein [Geodermatophilaceae bacterium]
MTAAGISPDDVGRRVVVRRRLPGQTGPTGGQAYTDVLGIVEHCDAITVSIRRSDDTLTEMLIVDVARAKRIPPPPVRRRP